MRVCLDLSPNEMLDRHGGFGRYGYYLLEHMLARPAAERAGLELWALPRSDRPPLPAELAMDRAVLDRPVISASRHRQQRRWLLGPLLLASGIDLFHSLHPAAMPLLPGPTLIATSHDIIPAVFPRPRAGVGTRLLQRWDFWQQWLRHRRPRHLIAISQTTCQDLVNVLGIAPDQITVIHQGVDARRFHPHAAPAEKAQLRARHGLPERWFLCVGSDHYRKNHQRLLQAWRQVAPFIPEGLVFVGKALYSDSLQRLLVEVSLGGLAPRFRWLDAVPDGELPALYRGATALVAPSLYEGFGMTLIEAMACGTPVAASLAASHPEVGGPAALYFDPESADQLALLLRRLSDQPGLRDQLRTLGLQRAARFPWDQTASATLDLYRRLGAQSVAPV